ncbi:MAG: hypothetical protein BGO88_04755 [Flavobacterium sp. 38-13]|uniref:hypothetical protein n=1 Tax=Flavobacterium sp. 38-13 TaxID=1896168 RepID=UPI00096062D5|nr:hypothetical protein [Flavobacterium sp. 38-13]OJX55527.1 MAG: hypothetical protein BGO88_04755 [Flavobacterium sp. 38-13]
MFDKTWNIERHKVGNGQQELQIAIIVREMETSFSTYSESWCNSFFNQIKEIPRTNNFSAEYACRAYAIDTYTVEIWKMDTKGEKKYKMFTVTKIR